MKRIAIHSLVLALAGTLHGQVYDFSAASAHMDANLAVYNNRVLVILEHDTKAPPARHPFHVRRRLHRLEIHCGTPVHPPHRDRSQRPPSRRSARGGLSAAFQAA
ncbi:MAG: hypothetical protein ABI162_10495 [Luteolibacter sp.]